MDGWLISLVVFPHFPTMKEQLLLTLVQQIWPSYFKALKTIQSSFLETPTNHKKTLGSNFPLKSDTSTFIYLVSLFITFSFSLFLPPPKCSPISSSLHPHLPTNSVSVYPCYYIQKHFSVTSKQPTAVPKV
jgi:hypothetical protein